MVVLMNNRDGMTRDMWAEKDDRGNTALYYSCLCGHVDVCHLLLQMMGGVGMMTKEELLRCCTNALSNDIRDLLNGLRSYEEIVAARARGVGVSKEEEEEDFDAFSIFSGEEEEDDSMGG